MRNQQRRTALSWVLAAALPLLALSALAIATTACVAAPVGVGFSVGIPAPPPLRAEVIGYRPGLGYTWIPGYWDWRGSSYFWVGGRWSLPPYRHAYWVAPRWEQHRYYRGHWRH